MSEGNFNLGGEQSGHIILGDYSTTGDGTLVALQVLSMLVKEKGKKISEITNLYQSVPQLLKNVEFDKNKGNPLEEESVKKVIEKCEEKLKGNGRLLIRKSGTQPLIRVMAESEDPKIMENVVNDIVAEIQKYV